jgi:replication factor A2
MAAWLLICPQVTFVGQIRSISTQPTNITYKIDDGTGLIEAKQWIDAESTKPDEMDLDPDKPKLTEEGYCRVWGRLKAFNNKRHVGAHIIRPITDYNEINYHLLEATAVHLFFTRGPPQGAQTNGHNQGATNGTANGNSNQSFADPQMAQIAGCSPLAKKVFAALKKMPQGNEGLHVQMIASDMKIPTTEVYKGAEELVAAGVIFTTVDDNTWAVLDA